MNKILIAICCFWANLSFAAPPTEIRLCFDEQQIYPLNIMSTELLNIAMKAINISYASIHMPWKRCLLQMQIGMVDGVVSSSFKTDRLIFGAYPMDSKGNADPAQRLYMSGYSLYRLKGSNLNFDGHKISNLTGKIGVQPGYAVIDQLQAMNVPINDSCRAPEDNFYKLLSGDLNGVALQTMTGNTLLKRRIRFSEKIEAIIPVLSEKPYYLMLSNQLVSSYPEFAKQIWEAIAKARDSTEYTDILKTIK